MSKKFNLNLNWYFKPSFDEADIRNTSVEGFEKIHLPHTVKELSYNCFSHDETAMVSTYLRKLTIPQEYKGKRAILVFDGVMARYELYVNGEKVTEHRGGYSRSFVDITQYLSEGENTLVMMVDSTENPVIPSITCALAAFTAMSTCIWPKIYGLKTCWCAMSLMATRPFCTLSFKPATRAGHLTAK